MQKQLLSRSIILEARWTMLLSFDFLLFKVGENRELFYSSFKGDRERWYVFILVSTKQFTTFLQYIAHNNFFPQLIAVFSTTHSSTKHTIGLIQQFLERQHH